MPFVPDEALQAVSPGEALAEPFAVFMDAAREVAGHANVERAIGPVRHDVDPAALPASWRQDESGEARRQEPLRRASPVMVALVATIHVLRRGRFANLTKGIARLGVVKTWMAGTSPTMTRRRWKNPSPASKSAIADFDAGEGKRRQRCGEPGRQKN